MSWLFLPNGAVTPTLHPVFVKRGYLRASDLILSAHVWAWFQRIQAPPWTPSAAEQDCAIHCPVYPVNGWFPPQLWAMSHAENLILERGTPTTIANQRAVWITEWKLDFRESHRAKSSGSDPTSAGSQQDSIWIGCFKNQAKVTRRCITIATKVLQEGWSRASSNGVM